MRALTSISNLFIAAALAVSLLSSCGGGDEPAEEHVDEEGCEHITEGPYVQVAAGTERAATAPAVGADHMAYSIAMPAGAPGYVAFAADAAGDHILFFDQAVPVKVFSSTGTEEPIEDSATGSDACAEIKGRHVVELTVGTHLIEIGAVSGVTLVNLVIEEAGAHADEH